MSISFVLQARPVVSVALNTALSFTLPLALLAGIQPVQAAAATDASTDEVVVTASPIAHDSDAFATIVGRVDRNDILRQGGANLADALSTEPGISGTGFATGASRPVIRGFDANRVRVLESGVGSFDVSDVGPDHGVPIDPLAAQRIEVVRGAASVRYGSQAIGGVVNVINNRVPTELPEQALRGEVSGAYGSGARSGEGSLLLDGKAGNLAWHADGFGRHSGDYDIPDEAGGQQSNSFFKGTGYSLGSSYFFGDSRVGAGLVHYDSQYGIPAGDTYIDMKQTKGITRSSFAIDAGAWQTLTVDGGYADYEHAERDPVSGEALATFKDREWDGRGEAILGAVGPFSAAALGVQMQHRDFSALGEGANYLLPTTTRSSAMFGFGEIPLSKIAHLEAGTRIERVELSGTPQSGDYTTRTFTPISASLGAVIDATDRMRFGLTVSSAARAPAQTELFARGPHDGPATYETGDPQLDIERANSLEGSLRLHGEKHEFELSLWTTRFDNYIHGNLTGRTCDEEGQCVDDDSQELREMIYVAEDARFHGAEASARFTLLTRGNSTLQARLFADYVHARRGDGSPLPLPLTPPYHVGGRLQWQSTRLNAGLQLKYTAARNEVAFGETPTASFVSLNAEVGVRPLASYPNLQFALIGSNLTDTVQRNAIALNKDDVVMPGRDLRLLMRLSF